MPSSTAAVCERATRHGSKTQRQLPIGSACAVVSLAIGLAACIHFIQADLGLRPEPAVMVTGVFFGLILTTSLVTYFWRSRGSVQPATSALVFLASSSLLLLATYFFWVSWYVAFPADILIWSESDFVNDTLKLATGYPLYTPQVNNDSSIYVPGAQLLTYFLAWLAGKAGSIPFYRAIQVAYTATAAVLAAGCCQRILRLAGVQTQNRNLWGAFRYAVLLLIAGNFITNRFTHNLHDDALAQLVTVAAYYLLLVYIETRSSRILAGMAMLIPLGFLVKESLVVWGVLYFGFLLFWGRNTKRLLLFTLASSAMLALVLTGCYALWGDPFFFWTMRVLGTLRVSPLRSFQHMLDAWTYFAAGLVGGAVVLRGRGLGMLFGAWLLWLGLFAVETYTSGIAWMLNHMGPGCLIAGVWFLAALTLMGERARHSWRPERAEDWIAAVAASASVVLLFSGMGLIRIPVQPFSSDAYRYVREIEGQFQSRPRERILLDAGSWNYVPNRIVMQDRATCIGDRGYAGIGDFSGILSRINNHRYEKILVRNLHEADFWYDHFAWPKPGGIRQALIDHYRETGHIRPAEAALSSTYRAEDPYLFGEITILEPKPTE